MMKQKIVILVAMPTARRRSRAMEVAAKACGVSTIEITGDLKDRLEVVGEGIDVVCLVRCLRKKLCPAEILQVVEVKPEEKKPEQKKTEEKKPEEKKKKPEEPKPCACPERCWCAAAYYCPAPPPAPMVLCCEETPANDCRIM